MAELTRAQMILQKLQEEEQRAKAEQMISLYPDIVQEQQLDYFTEAQRVKEARITAIKHMQSFSEEVLNILTKECLFEAVLKPVLGSQLANSHETQIGINTVDKFVDDHGAEELVESFKYKSYLLAELAKSITDTHEIIVEAAKKKMDTGATEADCFIIDDDILNTFIGSMTDKIPKDVTKSIADRVEDAIIDLKDSNFQKKTLLNKVYATAKKKTMENDDPNLNDEVQQEAARYVAVAKEKIYNTPNTVLESMLNLMVKSIHSIDVLKEAYSTPTNRIDMKKILNDTKVLYTFMECANTLNMVTVDEEYIKGMLADINESIKSTKQSIATPSPIKKAKDEEDEIENSYDTAQFDGTVK